MAAKWDVLITGGRVFDGTGGVPYSADVAIRGKKITEIGFNLDRANAKTVIDASEQWVMPGLFDIHTHFDLELEIAPGLPEAIRHGTTSVVIANCSLGAAFGNQRDGDIDPIVDCYARVENVPKHVLSLVADKMTWENPSDYLAHLDKVKMGPNTLVLLPHSMLRIEVMGFKRSVSDHPTADELTEMGAILGDALDVGYVGFSTDALPFHYLANDPNRHKTIPTQFAKYGELKSLANIVREKDRVWQATPPKDSMFDTARTFLLTSGRFFGKPLKVTIVAAMDLVTNRKIIRAAKTLTKVLNSRLINGHFYMQALGAPFKVWSEGMITPLSEEIPELRELVELDQEDRAGREAVMNDPGYEARFLKMWHRGKSGWGLSAIKHKLRLEDYALPRHLSAFVIERCPVPNWAGLTMQRIYDRFKAYDDDITPADLSKEEETSFKAMKGKVTCDGMFLLSLLRQFDTDLYWHTTTANLDPKKTRDLIMDPTLLPGFNDSGAHLTNMAFYDVNLRGLKLAQEGGEGDVAFLVNRLTKVPADFFGVDAGTLEVNRQADVIVIDPEVLSGYDGEAHVKTIFREEFQNNQLVNRSDGVVSHVMVNGKLAWADGDFTKDLGKKKMGDVLRPHQAESCTKGAQPMAAE